jgi:hypothetical protein
MWDCRFWHRRVWRWLSSGKLRRVVWYKMTDVSELLTASVLMMKTVSTSETSVNIYQTTRCNMPEDSHLHEISMFNSGLQSTSPQSTPFQKKKHLWTNRGCYYNVRKTVRCVGPVHNRLTLRSIMVNICPTCLTICKSAFFVSYDSQCKQSLYP